MSYPPDDEAVLRALRAKGMAQFDERINFPWENPDAAEHVQKRQPVWNLKGPVIRLDLPKRRPEIELPKALQGLSYGVVVMTHKGYSNGRLSILLSSLPANIPTHVSSDAITENERAMDYMVADYHGADFSHHTPWDGRAGHAIQCMNVTNWDYTLFLMDDVWLAPEVTVEALRWAYILRRKAIPLAALAIPGWELYHKWKDFGFTSWQDSLDRPQMLEAIPPHLGFLRAPCLFTNPFGACMLIMRDAYDHLGGFNPRFWANDDVFNHQVWLSDEYVNAAMPGRGYCHYGAQSWHHGESQKYVGEFKDATGMTAEESGKLQAASKARWNIKLEPLFLELGGTGSV